MVHHDAGLSSRFQYALNLHETSARVRTVVKDSVGVHDVEGVVGKGKMFGVCYLQIGLIASGQHAARARFERRGEERSTAGRVQLRSSAIRR